MLGVAANGASLVAVGMSFPPAHAAAWLSSDGVTWSQAPGLDAPEESLMTAVAVSPGRIVAVGGIARSPQRGQAPAVMPGRARR
jgi:hypothetical protein